MNTVPAINHRAIKSELSGANTHSISVIILFTSPQSLSGENSIDKLSLHYTKQDEENFALFNYVNELSYEVEMLTETVHRIQDDIGK